MNPTSESRIFLRASLPSRASSLPMQALRRSPVEHSRPCLFLLAPPERRARVDDPKRVSREGGNGMPLGELLWTGLPARSPRDSWASRRPCSAGNPTYSFPHGCSILTLASSGRGLGGVKSRCPLSPAGARWCRPPPPLGVGPVSGTPCLYLARMAEPSSSRTRALLPRASLEKGIVACRSSAPDNPAAPRPPTCRPSRLVSACRWRTSWREASRS